MRYAYGSDNEGKGRMGRRASSGAPYALSLPIFPRGQNFLARPMAVRQNSRR